MSSELFDPQQVLQQFAKAAPQYDSAAVLPQHTAQQLVERLTLIKLEVKSVLDIGSGTGDCLVRVAKEKPNAQLFALDPVAEMLAQTQQKIPQAECLLADAEAIPLANDSIDLITANMMLHWSLDIEHIFAEVQRVLRPGGVFLFSTLGPDTLQELRHSWAKVDEANHIHHFYDMHDLGDALLRVGFSDPVMDMIPMTMRYRALSTLFDDFKTMGVRNVAEPRKRGLTTPRQWRTMTEAYRSLMIENHYPVSYEVIYGLAWGRQAPRQRQVGDEVHISIDRITKATS